MLGILLINDKKIYLISSTVHVKSTGIELPNNNYDKTILDGELVFIRGINRYVFLAFDCLIHKGDNIRIEPSFLKRLTYIDDVINNLVFVGQKGYKFGEYSGNFDLTKILAYHDTEITKYMSNFKHDLAIDKTHVLIIRKYFIPVLGGQDNEIFKYSTLLWNKYTKEDATSSPYNLDGLIYHPLIRNILHLQRRRLYLNINGNRRRRILLISICNMSEVLRPIIY